MIKLTLCFAYHLLLCNAAC